MKRYVKKQDVLDKIQSEIDEANKSHEAQILRMAKIRAALEEIFPDGEFIDITELEQKMPRNSGCLT